MYLASLLGAPELYGLQDPFFGMSRSELSGCLSTLQTELIEQNLLLMDFSDNMQIAPQVQPLIEHCVFCDACITGTYPGAAGPRQFTLFVRNGFLAEVRPDGENLTVAASSLQELEPLLDWATGDLPSGTDEESACTFSDQQLLTAQQLSAAGSTDDARQQLRQTGMSDRLADTLLDGFQAKASIASVIATDFKTNHVEALLALASDGHLLCMQETGAADQPLWSAAEVACSSYRSIARSFIEKNCSAVS